MCQGSTTHRIRRGYDRAPADAVEELQGGRMGHASSTPKDLPGAKNDSHGTGGRASQLEDAEDVRSLDQEFLRRDHTLGGIKDHSPGEVPGLALEQYPRVRGFLG
ncbi:hypothetical protein NDU88_001153 [Pleurodeles waltl]|uniref:Uncharacterized protein n=1 Tax=Pleurodeles waltl TaxID=8319 RepID=A0AAV7VA43_PLEWA|nr:hypothetical protein NDU88_001153 [Pleurodeles waltl]